MHYTSNQIYNKIKIEFFKYRIDKQVLPFLTSLTTSLSFLTFLFNDIIPIARFGIITSFGILFTLIVVTIIYAIAIDYKFNQVKQHRIFKQFIDHVISFSLIEKYRFHLFMFLLFVLGIYSVTQIKIDNYLTDEVNKNSENV